jgi:hypothetical protein
MIKRIAFVLCLVLAVVCIPSALTSCAHPPSERVAQVQTLKAVGHTAEAAVATSAQLYAGGQITAEQARAINSLYDTRFQPAFRVAVEAVNANLESVASPELVALAAQLSALVLTYQKTK